MVVQSIGVGNETAIC